MKDMANDGYGNSSGDNGQGRSYGEMSGEQFSLLALYKQQIVKYEAQIEELKRELQEAREQSGQTGESQASDNVWTERKPAPEPEPPRGYAAGAREGTEPIREGGKPARSNTSLHVTYGIIILALVAFAAVMYVYPGAFESDAKESFSYEQKGVDAEEAVAELDSMAYAQTDDIVQDVEIYYPKLGKYRYSGRVNSDGMPNGRGEATFSNGDTFVGTFDEGAIMSGRYTWAQDGMYFDGAFTDCEPDQSNGSYYDKNDNRL